MEEEDVVLGVVVFVFVFVFLGVILGVVLVAGVTIPFAIFCDWIALS